MVVVALLAVLLAADRVTVIYAEHRVAARIKDEGSPAPPHVRIAGFPFLTQVVARRLNKVVVTTTGRNWGRWRLSAST